MCTGVGPPSEVRSIRSSGAEVIRICKLPAVGAEDWTRETVAAKLLGDEPSPVHTFVIHHLHCCVI